MDSLPLPQGRKPWNSEMLLLEGILPGRLRSAPAGAHSGLYLFWTILALEEWMLTRTDLNKLHPVLRKLPSQMAPPYPEFLSTFWGSDGRTLTLRRI